MGIFSKDIKTFDDLFVHTLRDMYYAENQIVSAAGDGREGDRWPAEEGFETHLDETKNHVERLERVFELHGAEASGVDRPPIVRSIVGRRDFSVPSIFLP
jgi:ferritin-like metal-binding protein YciE